MTLPSYTHHRQLDLVDALVAAAAHDDGDDAATIASDDAAAVAAVAADSDPPTRRRVLTRLVRLADDPQLRDRLTRDPDPSLRAAALRAIQPDDPAELRRRAAVVAADIVADPAADPDVRAAAALCTATSAATLHRLATLPCLHAAPHIAHRDDVDPATRVTAAATLLAVHARAGDDRYRGAALSAATSLNLPHLTAAYLRTVAADVAADVAATIAAHSVHVPLGPDHTRVAAVDAALTAAEDDPRLDDVVADALTSHEGLGAVVSAAADGDLTDHADRLAALFTRATAPTRPRDAALRRHLPLAAALTRDDPPPDTIDDADLTDLVADTTSPIHAGLAGDVTTPILAARLASARRVARAAADTPSGPPATRLLEILTNPVLPPAARTSHQDAAHLIVAAYPVSDVLPAASPSDVPAELAAAVVGHLARLTPGQAAALPTWHQPLPDLAATPL